MKPDVLLKRVQTRLTPEIRRKLQYGWEFLNFGVLGLNSFVLLYLHSARSSIQAVICAGMAGYALVMLLQALLCRSRPRPRRLELFRLTKKVFRLVYTAIYLTTIMLDIFLAAHRPDAAPLLVFHCMSLPSVCPSLRYPGVARTSGADLTETMRRQAEGFGAEFLLAEVTGLELGGDVKTVRTSRGALKCFGVLLATGAHPRMVGFRGEEAFRGRGVAYCATCDGEFFTGKDVFVVGGGFAAAEESVFLTKYARHVTILIREDDFTCAQATADAARSHEKITVLTNVVVEEVAGDTALRSIRMRHTKTGQVTEHRAADGETFGVFVFAGYEPATELVLGLADLDRQGYVRTDRSQKTSADGLYAAGDVCIKPLCQVVTAVGDGALAATELERLCAAMQGKTGLRPQPANRQDSERGIPPEADGGLFTADMLSQLQMVFERMASPLLLRLCLDETPLSAELERYMEALAAQSGKLSVERGDPALARHLPCVQVCRPDGSWTGLAFHGVPGGHEFTSFVLGLYNAAGPGQALDEETEAAIRAIRRPAELQVLVSLSCTMCPELVTAAQRLAAGHPDITAQVYDLNHFPDLRETYQVMSVPCLVVNGGEQITFGKKNIRQLLDLLTP